MRAPAPSNEELRLQTLHDYAILDSLPEQEYEDLVRLAASICGTPIAAVSLIDRDRQWFKAISGLEVQETSRDSSFCAHTILEPSRMLVVEDSWTDPRFADNPLVAGAPGIRFYAGHAILSPDGMPLGALCVIDDEPRQLSPEQAEALAALSRQVTSQLELRRTLRDLERKSSALNNALDAAEAGVRAKNSFLANMSHEIRTPLNGVIGMAEILSATSLTDRQRTYLDAIRRSGEGLLGMLSDVLELSQNEPSQTEPNLHPTSLPTILEELVGAMYPAAQNKGLFIDALSDPLLRTPLLADAVRLRQILTNLVGNAIKFTESGRIQVRARVRETAGPKWRVRFEVEDSGMGIAPERHAAIFEEFVQETDGMKRPAGPGLGLAIARRLVSLMGGEIGVESILGKGSTFSFDLDLQVSEAAPRPRQRRVLVVEDNEVNTMVITAMLEEIGCAVYAVENGLAAVETLRNEQFDMVFMDIHMPEMDGVTATQRVREMEGGRHHVPIVAVTASAVGDEESRCREAGMDALIHKPINERVIADALNRFAGVA